MRSDVFVHTAHYEIVCDSPLAPQEQGICTMYSFVALLTVLHIVVSSALQPVGKLLFPKRLTDLVQVMGLAQ